MMSSENRRGKTTFAALESYSMVGGIQQFNRRVISALSGLAPIGEPLTVILKGDKPEHVFNRPENANFIACASSRAFFLAQFLRQVWSSKFLYLGHINLLPVAIMARILSPRIKIILFVHGEDVWDVKGCRKKRVWEPLALRVVDRIASVSAFTVKRMRVAYRVPREKFTVFPNSVDPITTVNKSTVSRLPFRILTVARLAAHDIGKNHASVLRALALLRPQFPNISYQIVGDGVLRKELENLARALNVEDCVEFSGRVSEEQLDRAYNEASLFVMPSSKEGFGIVFLEAWQRGLPVVCGTEDASHEVITDGIDGYAIHHEDIEGLSERIAILLSDPDRATRMGEAGRSKVNKQYMMQNFIVNLDRLHKEVSG